MGSIDNPIFTTYYFQPTSKQRWAFSCWQGKAKYNNLVTIWKVNWFYWCRQTFCFQNQSYSTWLSVTYWSFPPSQITKSFIYHEFKNFRIYGQWKNYQELSVASDGNSLCTRMEKQEMTCHFISNSYKFIIMENWLPLRTSTVGSLILKFVIKRVGKFSNIILRVQKYCFFSILC